jgi:hypothetical protein
MGEAFWQHPGEFETEPTMARLCWRLRTFCLWRFSKEVIGPGNAALVAGEPFDVDRAFRR